MMGTLAALFSVLDGIDVAQSSQPVLLAPDKPLADARAAFVTGEGLEASLAEVEAQIRAARPMMRGARFEVVELANRDSPPLPLLQKMLCELHVAAACILQRQERWEEAQDHFVRAVATGAPDSAPAFFLVDFFRAQGRDRDALDALRTALRAQPLRAFTLIQFAGDLDEEGSAETEQAYRAAAEADASGLIAAVIAARRALGGRGMPDDDALDALLRRGLELLAQGAWREALAQFAAAAGFRPHAARTWRAIGDLLLCGDDRVVAPSLAEAAATLLRASALDETRRGELEQAAYAYILAAALDPELEGLCLFQAMCLACAGNHGAALAAAQEAIARRPDQAERHAVRALVAFLAGDHSQALQALAAASTIDPDDALTGLVKRQLPASPAAKASRP